MVRFLVPAAIVLVALTLYALFESLLTPAHRVRAPVSYTHLRAHET